VAKLAGVFAASHAPLLARDWHLFEEPLKAKVTAAYRALGARVNAARPDIIVEIAPDHWSNFFINNLPSVCIGVAETHLGPPEPFLKDFGHDTLPGDAAFGQFLLETALDNEFEPAVSHQLKLDHGFSIPLWRMELDPLPRIVPIVINSLEPPMPSIKRCFAWGRLIAEAIAAYPGNERIAVVASGGLSHSIGEPTMGAIDEVFDAGCIDAFETGGEAVLLDYLNRTLATAGNGAAEVRNWCAAHAAAGTRGFELIAYHAIPEVYVGCAWAAWNIAA
jgi:aromatic ring-opening dioxygenase catalytic subunit (LigB family)